jgi:hypothetical protein
MPRQGRFEPAGFYFLPFIMEGRRKERMGSIPRWKLFLADTLSMTVFSTVLCMSIEIGLAGLTFGQSLTARFAAVPTNLLTGRADRKSTRLNSSH